MRKQYTDEQIRQSIHKHGNGNPNDVFHVVCQEILGYTPLGGFISDMSEFNEFERRFKQVVAGKDSGNPAGSIDNGGQNEVDVYSQLVAQVRAGKPIYVNGQLNEQQTTLHMSVIRRLREETGMSVLVVYS